MLQAIRAPRVFDTHVNIVLSTTLTVKEFVAFLLKTFDLGTVAAEVAEFTFETH